MEPDWNEELRGVSLGTAALRDEAYFRAFVSQLRGDENQPWATEELEMLLGAAKQQKPGAVAAVKQSMKKYVDRLVRSSAASQETCSVTGGALAMRRNKRATNKGLKRLMVSMLAVATGLVVMVAAMLID